jgi:hypothetical protein
MGYCADSQLPGGAAWFSRYLKEINTFALRYCGKGGLAVTATAWSPTARPEGGVWITEQYLPAN